MELSERDSNYNFKAFAWHALFLAFATNFMDVNTIIPSMLIKVDAAPLLFGLLTTILIGGANIAQLFFAGFLLNKEFKKKYLITGINIRILALFGLSLLFYNSSGLSNNLIIVLIFLLVSAFSFSGAFANISYTTLLGNSIKRTKRKEFFSIKQVFNSIGIIISAFFVTLILESYGFPLNYSLIFLFACFLLLIASGGFWKLREVNSSVEEKKGVLKFLRGIPSEIKKSRNLKHYLIITNTLGVGLSIIPFFVLFAEDNFTLSYDLIGNFLLFSTLGMLLAGIILYRYSYRFTYKTMLRFSAVLFSIIPIAAIMLKDLQFIYQFIFILSGSFIALYKSSVNGLLLEISNTKNRVRYTGISGAGNIIPLLFPLLAGFLIPIIGYFPVFSIVSVIVLLSYLFVARLDCKVKAKQVL